MRRLIAIVEGHGEVAAVPVLLRRMARQIAPEQTVVVAPPLRVSRSKIVKPRELEKYTAIAARQVGAGGGILLLLDADRDCPAELAPALLSRAASAAPHHSVAVVLAKAEYEAWFLASAASLGGSAGLARGFTAPADPEAVRDAKGRVGIHLPAGAYRPTKHQEALTLALDFELARTAPSFDKLWREVAKMIAAPHAPGRDRDLLTGAE